MGQGVAFVDWDTVSDTVSGVHHNSSRPSGGVEGQHCLDVDVHGGGIERLEHDLRHLLPVSLRVERGLSEEDWVLLRSDPELVVEGVVPDLLHVVPVGHDPVLDRVLEGQDAPLRLRLVPNVGVLLAHSHHHTNMPGPSYDRGEDGPEEKVFLQRFLGNSDFQITWGHRLLRIQPCTCQSHCQQQEPRSRRHTSRLYFLCSPWRSSLYYEAVPSKVQVYKGECVVSTILRTAIC